MCEEAHGSVSHPVCLFAVESGVVNVAGLGIVEGILGKTETVAFGERPLSRISCTGSKVIASGKSAAESPSSVNFAVPQVIRAKSLSLISKSTFSAEKLPIRDDVGSIFE